MAVAASLTLPDAALDAGGCSVAVLVKVPVWASSAGEKVLPAPPRPEWAYGAGGEVVVRMGTMEPVREALRCCDSMSYMCAVACQRPSAGA